jgi:pimeloyl-ACP methyl ester carboxylesterase
MPAQIPYDEFAYFQDNASEFGIPYDGPPTVRRERYEVEPGRALSALVWGTGAPELVFLHGGAQNAHTWDTVALALDRPLVAIDLPGHGHSDAPRESSIAVQTNAADVATVIRAAAPDAAAVIGMSLGGMTSIALADAAPELVRSLVLVDVTPGVNQDKSRAISDFINGPESFPSFEDILARTIEHNPTRTEASLRRGILHNAKQRPDGSWVWRYARFRAPAGTEAPTHPDFSSLWDAVSRLTMPVLLVRGMRPQSVVDDADEAELLRRVPTARVEHVQDAGHSVQGDTPVELAHLIDAFAPAG